MCVARWKWGFYYSTGEDYAEREDDLITIEIEVGRLELFIKEKEKEKMVLRQSAGLKRATRQRRAQSLQYTWWVAHKYQFQLSNASGEHDTE